MNRGVLFSSALAFANFPFRYSRPYLHRRWAAVAWMTLLGISVSPEAVLAQFGVVKKRVVRERLQPPRSPIWLRNTDVALGVRGRRLLSVHFASEFEQFLRHFEIPCCECLRWDGPSAPFRLECTVVGYQPARYRILKRPKTPTDRWIVRTSASARMQCRLFDQATGELLHEKQFSSSASQNTTTRDPNLIPTEVEVEGRLFEQLARMLLSEYCPRPTPVTIYLPKGSLEEVSELVIQGDYHEALLQLQQLGTAPDPLGEAYRQYLHGAIYEIRAYEVPLSGETLQLLEKARDHYDAARRLHPEEKYFRQALKRVQKALRDYSALLKLAEGPTQ